MTRSALPPPVRHEADLAREANQRFRIRGAPSGGADPHDLHATWAMKSGAVPVRSLSVADVTLPPDTSRFVGEEEARALQALLLEVRELNEQHVGDPQLESFVCINGTPEQSEIIARSRAWAARYVTRRLARPSTRDAGSEYRRFVRLWSELVHFLDNIGIVEVSPGEFRSTSVVGQYLAPMCDFVAWSFFEGTWAKEVVWADDWALDIPGLRAADSEVGHRCVDAFGVYRWKASRQFDRAIRELARALADRGAGNGPDDEERARTALLAEDIAEMRPFLVRNFPTDKALIELPDGLVAGFAWDTLDRIGTLHCASTERDLFEERQSGIAKRLLALGYDGRLRCSVNWFHDVASIPGPLPFPAVAVGRIVLEALHARLYGFFDKIDLDAVRAGWIARERPLALEAESGSVEDEAAVIAASIMNVDRALGADGCRGGRIATSMRLSHLTTVLEGRFGCTSRSSKGSELVFYRPGARHAFISRHKVNPLVPAIAIQRMLRKLGIAVHEWLAATTA